MPAISKFVDGSGIVVAGKLFPFCFITIACGAISGFHTLISSGTTPKIITRESYARPIGYGAMCLESLVAIMALIAACTLDPGVYLSINYKAPGTTPAAIAQNTIATVNATGFPVSADQMEKLANEIGEKTLFGRTGGAATLAVGMAVIFSKAVQGRFLDLWYHFAIMFEALFILTTLDAGTRVGRYLLQDVLGHFSKTLGNTANLGANVFASVLVVLGWGYFLIQGVRDPLGGINSLWPLFGIANQLLASIALCLVTTVILKMHLAPASELSPKVRRPQFALITFIPLLWLMAVTMTAGYQKIFDPSPKIGFLSAIAKLDKDLPALQQAEKDAPADPLAAAKRAVTSNRVMRFNFYIDAIVAGAFLVMVALIFAISVYEWLQLLARKRLADLRETPPSWLPDYAIAEVKPSNTLSYIALLFGLAKELSGQAEIERAHEAHCACATPHEQKSEAQLYVSTTEARYKSIRRCC
jgi:carbon starvation protein